MAPADAQVCCLAPFPGEDALQKVKVWSLPASLAFLRERAPPSPGITEMVSLRSCNYSSLLSSFLGCGRPWLPEFSVSQISPTAGQGRRTTCPPASFVFEAPAVHLSDSISTSSIEKRRLLEGGLQRVARTKRCLHVCISLCLYAYTSGVW